MKKVLIAFLVLAFTVVIVDDASAQRRGKKKRRTRTEDTEQTDDRRDSRRSRDRDSEEDYGGTSIMDNLNIEIKPGNLFIGNSTSLSLKSNVGYKFTKDISAGVGGKILYFWQSNGLNSVSTTDYGGLVYAKAKVSQEFYLVGEYNFMSLGSFNSDFRETLNYPTAGIGYMRPGIDWSSGFELLFVFSAEARNKLSLPLEYWFNFSYNF